MRELPRDEELRQRTAEALARLRGSDRGDEPGAGHGEPRRDPQAGDLYVSDESADYAVQWLVLGAEPQHPGRLQVVVADSAPFAGSADVVVPRGLAPGALTLRSRFVASIEPRALAPGNRVGQLPEELVSQVRERAASLASGSYRPTVLEQETEADPEFRDWVEEVLEPACAALGTAARGPGRSGAPMGAQRWPQALAAVFLLTSIGLSVWVVELRKTVEVLSEPAVLSAVQVVVGEGSRSPEEISAPPGTSLLLIEVVLDDGIEAYDQYRVELWDRSVRLLDSGPQPGQPGTVYPIVLPRIRFPDGEYRLILYGLAPQGAKLIEERRLLVESER